MAAARPPQPRASQRPAMRAKSQAVTRPTVSPAKIATSSVAQAAHPFSDQSEPILRLSRKEVTFGTGFSTGFAIGSMIHGRGDMARPLQFPPGVAILIGCAGTERCNGVGWDKRERGPTKGMRA